MEKPMRLIQKQILGQNIKVGVSPLGDAWNKDKIDLPDHLEEDKAIEEVYASLKEVLIEEYGLEEEEGWTFFPAPFFGVLFLLSAIKSDDLPPEVAKRPGNFWYDINRDEWCKR